MVTAGLNPDRPEADFETALQDPAQYYAEPEAVQADTTLSREQKLRFLNEWAQDLKDRQCAEGEGMTGDDVDCGPILKRVQAALAKVEAEDRPAPEGGWRTLWQRLTG
jgi:hypothetical protein